ncbi:MAG TPA: LemA family protein [Bacteroidales bacterium]|nr:LemA family protein [Bacteroidales bacterium]
MTGILIFSSILILYFVAKFNGLVRSKNRVDYAVGGMNAILKKRFDLIPNLIDTVKVYVDIEKEMLARLDNIRAGKTDLIAADEDSTHMLATLLRSADSIPQLKAGKNFLHLQQTMSEVEEQLSAARRTYNANVMVYNNKIGTVPSSVFAKLLKYEELPMFSSENIKKTSFVQ